MPRKIIGAAFVSLDGVMQAPGGPDEDPTGGFDHGGWIAALFEEALGNQVGTVFTPPYDLLLGRKTYEIFAAHWPFVPDDDPIGAQFRTIRKYVLTSSDAPLTWDGSVRLDGLDALDRLRQEDGPNLVIQGSSTLYPQLFARGLIDQLVLMTAPVALGRGKRIWGEGMPATAFKMVEHRVTAGGFSMGTYEPAGEVRTASFEFETPTPAELERRERMKREG